jgi:transposase
MAPKRVLLSFSEKNAIAALHKAGLKGPTIARETGHPLSTIYGVLRCFKQRGTVENKERSGRPSLLTLRDTVTRKLYGVVKSDRKRPLREVTNIFNELRARPVSDRTVQRKLYKTKYQVCCKKKASEFATTMSKNGWCKLNRHKTVNYFWKKVIHICILVEDQLSPFFLSDYFYVLQYNPSIAS